MGGYRARWSPSGRALHAWGLMAHGPEWWRSPGTYGEVAGPGRRIHPRRIGVQRSRRTTFMARSPAWMITKETPEAALAFRRTCRSTVAHWRLHHPSPSPSHDIGHLRRHCSGHRDTARSISERLGHTNIQNTIGRLPRWSGWRRPARAQPPCSTCANNARWGSSRGLLPGITGPWSRPCSDDRKVSGSPRSWAPCCLRRAEEGVAEGSVGSGQNEASCAARPFFYDTWRNEGGVSEGGQWLVPFRRRWAGSSMSCRRQETAHLAGRSYDGWRAAMATARCPRTSIQSS
jgi:hypothetical protein